MFINKKIIAICILLLSGGLFAQSTTLQLPLNDNTTDFSVLNNSGSTLFKVFGNGGFYSAGSGSIPVSGAGARLMWYPGKASFRVGEVSGAGSTFWDDVNIGSWSAAMGNNARASGNYSLAIGLNTTSSGAQSIALGNNSTASGDNSFAFNGTASDTSAVSFGLNSLASGPGSLAMGNSSQSTGTNSVAIGPSLSAGLNTVAIGFMSIARGDYSLAFGKYAHSNHNGSVVFGDGSGTSEADSVYSTSDNQLVMRFAGGYRFYTNQNLSSGVFLDASGNSWSSISDSSKKENILFHDKDYFLASLSKLRLGSWNYKSQDVKIRHYGPMAQEIFSFFGHDNLGTIGNDTTLASADMDGIIMICLQSLDKKAAELKQKQDELSSLVNRINELKNIYQEQETKLSSGEKMIDEVKSQIVNMKKELSELADEKIVIK